jgi:hypothetical protein
MTSSTILEGSEADKPHTITQEVLLSYIKNNMEDTNLMTSVRSAVGVSLTDLMRIDNLANQIDNLEQLIKLKDDDYKQLEDKNTLISTNYE